MKGLLCLAGEVGQPAHIWLSTFRTQPQSESTSLPPAQVFISRALVPPLGQKRNAEIICPSKRMRL